ncbi:unnamed protein product [Owenia fusiformis]|uniref:Acetyl-coenzyme A synthetase n=1 Tax=Owenia fusiformis TaxID=6347 RepID=A0A8J1Y698_OWEFU|nr:unnamed protein product [Owenia fusiformis]
MEMFKRGSLLVSKSLFTSGRCLQNGVRRVKKKQLYNIRYASSAQVVLTSTKIPEFNGVQNLKTHQDLHEFSLKNPEDFWGKLARSRLEWFSDFDRVQETDMTKGLISWFLNGKLNVSVNCVDRHMREDPNRVALLWEKDEPGCHQAVTYKELYDMMNKIGNTLRSHGVRKGDRVAMYMPVSPYLVASMLACARIGAIHNVIFAGFSAEALATRINDAAAETVITADQGLRGGKIIELKKTVDEAVSRCDCVKRVFVTQRTGNDVSRTDLDFSLEEEMAKQHTECDPEPMDSEDFLFMLYTSGSTGKPKGIAHSQAGYLLYAALTHQLVFDCHPGDVWGCVADIGWITGHSYVVYGPLCNGVTSVLFESIPTYPDAGRYWETVERLKMTQIYVAPTAVRLLLKSGNSFVTKYDRSSLRLLGCVGEPLNHEAFEWYHDVVGEGRCPLVDTWWQTETGGICISPRPSAPGAEIKPAMPMRPFFGIDPVLVDEKGNELEGNDKYGALCIRSPWPGMARTLYGNHDRFLETYFKPYPGLYFSGDGAHRHADGYYQITGRMDDVINVSGHRLGTAEIEDAMDEHPMVAETAVVGFPHDIKGEGVYAYVTLMDEIQEPEAQIIQELKEMVKKQIASYAVPEIVQIAPGLPKTRSGKIMRRILRNVAANKSDQLGDISTLADPSVVASIVKNHEDVMKIRNGK